MGLDFVEIIMEVEDRLCIVFDEEDLFEVSTLGQFHNAVISKMNFDSSLVCASQRYFYKFRKYCINQLGQSRESIRLERKLNTLFQEPISKEDWIKLYEDLA